MKLWKRWTAAVLAAAMALLLLAACGPSGPSAPDAPDTPGSSETGKDPTDEKTEEQKAAAVVDTLNTVRKNYGNNTPLELNEQACAFAKEMAQVQLDGVNGKYGKNPSTNRDYTAACANVRKKMVGEKKGIDRCWRTAGRLPGCEPVRKVGKQEVERRDRESERRTQQCTGQEGSHPCGRGRCA